MNFPLCKKWKKIIYLKKKTSSLGWKDDPNAVFFLLIADKILYNIFYTVSLGFCRFLPVATTPVPNVLGKCWKVAHWSAKKLLRKVHPKFLDIFILKDVKVLFFILHNNCLHRSQKLA